MKVLHYVDDNVLSWARPYIQLLGALREKGCENVIACRPGGTFAGMLRDSGFEVHTCKPLMSSWPGLALGFCKIVRSVRPDIIHTRLSSAANIAGLWGKRLSVPVLATIDKYPKPKYYENVTLLLPCSESVAEYMVSQGVPAERMTVLPNAADVKAYARNDSVRESVRRAEGLDDRTICFLGMGRFVDWKGFDDLLKAFAEIVRESDNPQSLTLWLAGNGEESESLKGLAAKLGVQERVKFWGFVDDVKPILWGADVYVHPSWGDEAFGLSLLEAMSAGLPAAAAQSGGMTEILKDSCGLLFPKRDVKALVRCMKEAAANAEVLGEAALSRAWDFDISAIAARTLNIYTKILNG